MLFMPCLLNPHFSFVQQTLIIKCLLCARGYLKFEGFSSEQNRPIVLTFVELKFQKGDKDNIQNKKVNDILDWRMVNATEEKKAKKELENDRLVE